MVSAKNIERLSIFLGVCHRHLFNPHCGKAGDHLGGRLSGPTFTMSHIKLGSDGVIVFREGSHSAQVFPGVNYYRRNSIVEQMVQITCQ